MIQFNQLPCEISDKICDMASDAWLIDLIESLYVKTQMDYRPTGSPEVLTNEETDEFLMQPDSYNKESLDAVFDIANRLEDLCRNNVMQLDILGYVDDWVWQCVVWPLLGAGNPSRANLELIEHALLWGKDRGEHNHRAERDHVVFLDGTQLVDLPAVKPYTAFVREGQDHTGDLDTLLDGAGAWVHVYPEMGPMAGVVNERCFVFLAERQVE